MEISYSRTSANNEIDLVAQNGQNQGVWNPVLIVASKNNDVIGYALILLHLKDVIWNSIKHELDTERDRIEIAMKIFDERNCADRLLASEIKRELITEYYELEP